MQKVQDSSGRIEVTNAFIFMSEQIDAMQDKTTEEGSINCSEVLRTRLVSIRTTTSSLKTHGNNPIAFTIAIAVKFTSWHIASYILVMFITINLFARKLTTV